MPAHIDIHETARSLIRQYGDKAAIQAGREVDACMASGDMERAYSWQRVIACIHDLTASPTEHVQ
jgi:hypothetical protein